MGRRNGPWIVLSPSSVQTGTGSLLCLGLALSAGLIHAGICAWKNPAAPWFPLGAAVSALLSGPSQGPSCLGAVPSQLSRGVMADAEDRTL